MSRKYGTGEYARGGKKFEQRMKPGESKFQYDVRMRKEGRKTPSTKPGSTKSSYQYQKDPDPSTEITGLTGGLSYDWKTQEHKRSLGDYREQGRWAVTTLPSAPGDEWEYTLRQDDGDTPVLWAGKGDDWHKVEPGSDSDKAIRDRYTGSETGDLSNWYGYDMHGIIESSSDTEEGDMDLWDRSYESYRFKGESYLPYDLAQKKYNPNYKGSKK